MPTIDQQSGSVSSNALRARAHRLLGGGYSPLLRWFRRYRPEWLWMLTSPLGRVTVKYITEHDLQVRRGLCAGIVYPREIVAHAGYVPAKLLGCYEAEIHAVLAQGTTFGPDTVVNVGSGDGYFAVGLARLLPNAHVIAYETDDRERDSARRLAEHNGLSLDLRGTCRRHDLFDLGARPFLLVDIEGGELQLLDPARAPGLRSATMVVETHDPVGSSVIAETLRSRFATSHSTSFVSSQPRLREDFPELAGWNTYDADMAVTEGRPAAGNWMVLTPNQRTGDNASARRFGGSQT